MRTAFSPARLADPDTAVAASVIRSCVHCGFCTATCPTYVLEGDERDSPRGRIALIKDMLENDRPATEPVVRHIDRCLSCLACMTTCPSGVNYMHLVDHARRHVERTYRRPFADRVLRRALGAVLPRPALFRLSLRLAGLARPAAALLPRALLPRALRPLLALAPGRVPPRPASDRQRLFPAEGARRRRVALLTGCAQRVLDPGINEATIRLLTRHGCEVVVAPGTVCCGALNHHLGQDSGREHARRAVEAWHAEIEHGGLDAIVVNTSGCGTTVKEYGFLFRDDEALAGKAARVAALARDVTELIAAIGLVPPVTADRGGVPPGFTVAYHAACSLQHGQGVRTEPRRLLAEAGFTVLDVPEGHLCCGSAGTYNLLQPAIATRLRDRKIAHLERLAPSAIAAGNIGCLTQLASGTAIPLVHTAALLDWATGGPRPAALAPAAHGTGGHGAPPERAGSGLR